MPNRILKESIKYSDQIDSLTWFEEVVFYRLIVSADDYGCCDGRVNVIRNELFPTKDNVTRKSVEDAIARLASVGLLCKYTVSGKPYLSFPSWERHQRTRNKIRKFPEPPSQPTTTCCQLTASRGQLTATCGLNPIQSESESESESKPKPESARVRADGGDSLPSIGEDVSPAEIDAARQAIPAIERACRGCGMPFNTFDHGTASALLGQYSADAICKAVAIAAERGKANWGFIKGVLQRGVDSPPPQKPGALPVRQVAQHRYSQRSYTPQQDEAIFTDIFSDDL